MRKAKTKKTLQERLVFDDKDLKTPVHDKISWWLDENIEELLIGDRDKLKQHLSKRANEMKEAVEKHIAGEGFTVAEIQAYTVEEKALAYEELRAQQASFSEISQLRKTKEVQLYSLQSLLSQADEITGLPIERLFPQVIDKTWESPIKNKKGEVIGFVDMKVVYEQPYVVINTGGVWPTWELSNQKEIVCFEIKSSIRSLGELIRQIHLYQSYEKEATFVVVSPDDRFVDKLRSQGIGFQKYSLGTDDVEKLL